MANYKIIVCLQCRGFIKPFHPIRKYKRRIEFTCYYIRFYGKWQQTDKMCVCVCEMNYKKDNRK